MQKAVRDVFVKAGDSEYWLSRLVGQQTSATSPFSACVTSSKLLPSLSPYLTDMNQEVNELQYVRYWALYLALQKNVHSQAQD